MRNTGVMELDRPDRYGALAIALFGFLLTRVFVIEAAQYGATLPALVVGFVPLFVGLGLSLVGVALAVGSFSRQYVRSVTIWWMIGTATMGVVVAISALPTMISTGLSSNSYLLAANALLGGAVGGVVIGDRSAANARQRGEIRRQANRALFVNRLLRHDVINAAAIIDGHTSLLSNSDGTRTESVAAIERAVTRINDTVDDVGRIAVEPSQSDLKPIDIRPVIDRVVESVESDCGTPILIDSAPDETTAYVGNRIELVFRELLRNAGEYGETVIVSIDQSVAAVQIKITDDGPGLPDMQRRLLESGEFPEFDDPSAGFGLQIVSLLTERYRGEITVETPESGGTQLTLTLPRGPANIRLADAVGVTFPNLQQASISGIAAGVLMGMAFVGAGSETLPVIGALYGLASPTIGWITHLFHSIVFAVLFSAGWSWIGVDRRPRQLRNGTVLGLAWGTALWLVAAGVVMPIWLRFVGISAPVPDLSVIGFVTHAVWGVSLGITYTLLSDASIDPIGRLTRWVR